MSQESLDYVPDFTVRREEFVLHNAGPDKIDAMWAGHPFTIPGCDEIHPTNPAQFEDGSPIPGTVILRDDYMALPGGSMPQPGSPYNWRASVAIKNVLGIDKHTGKAISSYSKKGVSYLRMPATKEDLESLMIAGKRRYYEFMVEWADHQVRAYGEAVDRSNRAGVASPPPGSDYHKAVSILKRHEQEMEKRYGKQEQKDLDELAEEDDVEFMLWAKARLTALADQAAKAHKVDKQKLVEDSLEDPEMLKALRKKYRLQVHRIGYAEGVIPEKEKADAPRVTLPSQPSKEETETA